MWCTNPETEVVWKEGVVAPYRWFGQDGVHIVGLSVELSDCMVDGADPPTLIEADLPLQAVRLLEGKARLTDAGAFEGHVWNGNQDWVVTSLTVRIADPSTNEFREYFTNVYPQDVPRERVSKGSIFDDYSDEELLHAFGGTPEQKSAAPVGPTKIGQFRFAPYKPPAGLKWNIVSTRGYKG